MHEQRPEPLFVTGSIPGDVNGDRRVNLPDVFILADAWGTCAGEPGYNSNADFTGDDCVNLPDVLILGAHWSESM